MFVFSEHWRPIMNSEAAARVCAKVAPTFTYIDEIVKLHDDAVKHAKHFTSDPTVCEPNEHVDKCAANQEAMIQKS